MSGWQCESTQVKGLAMSDAHSSGGQPWTSRLASRTHVATEAQAGACSSRAPAGKGKEQERFRWLVSANMNSCGANAGEIGRGSALCAS